MNRIKTKLKFKKSDKTGHWVGFVSQNKVNKMLRGVHEDDPVPKLVCVVTNELVPYIESNLLYDVEMVPMKKVNNNGYIVVKATPHAFPARIETNIVKHAVYEVHVRFGNQDFVFNPLDGDRDSVRSMDKFIETFGKRRDVKDILGTIDRFKIVATALLAQFEKDGYYVPKKK